MGTFLLQLKMFYAMALTERKSEKDWGIVGEG